ncbi:MAG: YoaK family protein [Bacillota bacterium]|nr:YoaK family protein [Bacillota bacterium]
MITKEIASVQNKIRIQLPSITSESMILGILLTLVGGFLDAYTFIGRGGVFANAQTGNMVLVAIEAFKGNWNQVLLQSLPVLAFMAGVIVSEAMKKNNFSFFISNSKGTILALEIVILFIVGFIPYTISNAFVTITIAFVTSLQYCSFKKLADSPYATTMCTGNLRSASQAAYAAITKKDREAAKEAVALFTVIFAFIIGAFLGGLLTISIGTHAVWIADILLVLSLVLLDIG